MAARKKQPTADDSRAEPGQKPIKRPTPLGTDRALTVRTSGGESIVLSYWGPGRSTSNSSRALEPGPQEVGDAPSQVENSYPIPTQ